MKVLYIDLETTGLDPKRDQILEVGMLLDDLQRPDCPIEDCPSFEVLVDPGRIKGHPLAIAMNIDIIRMIADPSTATLHVTYTQELLRVMYDWLKVFVSPRPITIGGKNPSFDIEFLVNAGVFTDRWDGLWFGDYRIHHRKLDPTFCFFDVKRDLELPNTNTCLERAGVQKQTVHRALDDCKNIAMLVRAEMKRRN